MSIKNLKPTKKTIFKQGYFPLNEAKKYKGNGPIIYRSSWELKFCNYCERTPEIIEWSSESFSIKYFNPIDKIWHNYYPDFIITLNTGETIIIEVKPKSQIFEKPIPPKRKTRKAELNYVNNCKTWIINNAKRLACTEFANLRGFKYEVITEDFFKNKT